jgi:hypothetical protein
LLPTLSGKIDRGQVADRSGDACDQTDADPVIARKRPCCRRREKRDELAPIHVPTPSSGDCILSAQTSTLMEAETGIKTIAAVHNQCL